MNTQVGKSIGIALLLAAGLIAALFAMGVFAPVGVDAEVRTTPMPTANLSSNEPGEEVTLTITFELSEPVDGTTLGANVTIGIPSAVTPSVDTSFDTDNISVTQDGSDVGSVEVAANEITIGQPAMGSSNGRVESGVLTTVVISGLTLVDTAATGNVTITQQTGAREVEIAVHPSVTSASLAVDDGDAYAMGPPAMGNNVTMTLTFTADTASSGSGNNEVMITLPKEYDLSTATQGTVDTAYLNQDAANISVSPSGVQVTTNSTDNAAEAAETLAVHTFSADTEVTVTISGLTNPETSAKLMASFKQTDAQTMPVKAMAYITKMMEAAVTGTISSNAAGATDVKMTLSFTAIDAVTDDHKTEIELTGVSGLSMGNIDVEKMDDGDYVDVDNAVSVMGDVITIGARPEEPATNAMGIDDGDMVMVTISGLTNGMAGQSLSATVKQGEYAAGMVGHNEFTIPADDGFTAPPSVMAPGPVKNIAVEALSDTELEVSWEVPDKEGSSAITGYSVKYRDTDGIMKEEETDTTTDLGITLTGLAGDTTYRVRVAAMNGMGDAHTGPYARAIGTTDAAQATGTITNTLEKTVEAVSDDEPGAAVKVTLMAKLEKPFDSVIKIKLDKFGLPDSIDTGKVTIRSNDGFIHYQGNPTSVTISESTVSLTLGTLKGLTDSSKTLTDLDKDRVTTITIQQSAGIMNPTAAKVYDIEVGDDKTTNKATVNEKVTVKPTSGARESEITVTGKGFGSGTATIQLDNGKVLASNVAIEDGSFEHTLTVGDEFKPGKNTINAIDGDGDEAAKGDAAEFTVKPKVTADPDEATPAQEVTIKVSDWSVGRVTRVTFGGPANFANITSNSTGGEKGELEITVPGNARIGVNKVSLMVGTKAEGTVNITVKALELTVSPSSVVPGQRITITGSDFVKNTKFSSIMIGGKPADDLPDDDDRASTSTGRIAYTVTVPLDIGDGDKKVEVKVGAKTGIGAITVPEPSITVSPAVSAPGTVISVQGTGFASEERLEVNYKGAVEAVGKADSNGDFTIRFDVPSDAGIGDENTVEAVVRRAPSISAEAEHKTPGSMIELPEQVQVGTRIMVKGTNFEPFSVLKEVVIGGHDALPSPAPETDKNGAFEFEVRVPRLDPGSHTVTVKDGSKEKNSATETFEVTTTPIVSAPQEVFGVLGDNLTVVWRYDNAEQSWASYSPGAPAELNDLTGVSRGDIVWIEVGAAAMFQGGSLYAGWNLISLE